MKAERMSMAEYAILAKRPGREPGDSVGSIPTSVTVSPFSKMETIFDPVVQRLRLLRDVQATAVQLCPGSFRGLVCRCFGGTSAR